MAILASSSTPSLAVAVRCRGEIRGEPNKAALIFDVPTANGQHQAGRRNLNRINTRLSKIGCDTLDPTAPGQAWPGAAKHWIHHACAGVQRLESGNRHSRPVTFFSRHHPHHHSVPSHQQLHLTNLSPVSTIRHSHRHFASLLLAHATSAFTTPQASITSRCVERHFHGTTG
ncbi:uncharacterized protein F5Z01DRAFT_7256 [Emericellopsis atlantica]|uniref:Uncharacterized protein n=1 Tax=Emericellopsis atlantica TaxID=2614577 RepID=A0A9P8CX53_9HYPO|nr:uncharacterized protein F5Z01DRAFT_7256 [Emericellopsis atlantica]KAG9258886.1 hypothetical protein F5Z01DRAFT_7256 [Emericellopsis atlantica]